MKKRLNINDILGDEVQKPVTTFEEADRKETLTQEPTVNKGGRPIKGSGKAIKKVAFHIDEETWELFESIMDFPKEKSVNAVCKRAVEHYAEIIKNRSCS